jgi:hypothetical protein
MTSSSKTTELPRKQSEEATEPKKNKASSAKEYGGPKGPEPTRYGTWEKNGIEVDF